MIALTSREARLFATALDLACEISLRSGNDRNIPSVAAFLDAMESIGQIATLGKKLGRRDVPFGVSPELEQEIREYYKPRPIEGDDWKA